LYGVLLEKITWNGLKVKCLFFKDGKPLFVYVHDLDISAKTVDLLNQFKCNLPPQLQIKDLGRPKFILGVQIIATREDIFSSEDA
jgi:hypothetical protein